MGFFYFKYKLYKNLKWRYKAFLVDGLSAEICISQKTVSMVLKGLGHSPADLKVSKKFTKNVC